MKNERTDLSSKYLRALRTHVSGALPAGDSAQKFGRAVLASGFISRDLALMPEQALVALAANPDFATTDNGRIKRAGHFFTQALIPIETAQRATGITNRLLQQRNATLRLQAAALAKANARLKAEISRRKAGEVAIRSGKEQYKKLLAESQIMQLKLREVTRQIISAQEEERKEISRELHDEVVQTLVGINVQLSA